MKVEHVASRGLAGAVSARNAAAGSDSREAVTCTSRPLRTSLQAAIEQSTDCIVVFDATGRVEYVNPAYLSWSGWEVDGVLDKAVWKLPGRPRRREDLGWARRQLASGMAWQREISVWFPEAGAVDRQRFVFVTVSPVFGDAAELLHFVAILRDVTERRRLEAIAEIHNFHDNLGYVFAGLRHELGNPINSLKAALRFVLDSLDDMPRESLRSYLLGMKDGIARVENLLHSLRTYNLYQEPRLEEIPVAAFLNRFAGLIRPEIVNQGIDLQLDLAVEETTILGDTGALHQILLNLVANAREAVARVDEKRIAIVAVSTERRVRVGIRDNGTGIAASHLEEVFRPFFTTRRGGTGLGLAISRRLAALMYATLDLESSRNGTTAWLTLNRAEGDGP